MRGAKGRVKDNFSFSAFQMPVKWLSLEHTLVVILKEGKIIDYFASLSLKAGELKTCLRKDEFLELPRLQNTSKMFSVVATTRNSSTTHRSRRSTREKWQSRGFDHAQ